MTDNITNNSCIPLPIPNIAEKKYQCSLLACVRSDSYEVGDPKDKTTCSVSVCSQKRNTCTCNYKDKNLKKE